MAATSDATSYIGARLTRQDGPPKVAGEARYAADLSVPGTLHVRLLLSPYPHARILSMNGAAARDVPGVVAVVTASDLAPFVKAPPASRARCLLAGGEVRYCGQPVVAVVAESEAGGLVSYSWNPTDAFRIRAAMIDKILKGAKPADLPMQGPTRFDLVINQKTARALGLVIPPSALAQATDVIE